MKFDTLLKLGTHAAKIVQHDAFQEMSKMIHRGVKRRMQVPEKGQQQHPHVHPSHWISGPHHPPYRNRYHELPPHGNPPQHAGRANQGPQLKSLLKPDHLNAVRQLVKGIANRGNNK